MLFANKDLYKQKHYNELLYKLKGSNRQPVIDARLLYEPYHVGIYDVACIITLHLHLRICIMHSLPLRSCIIISSRDRSRCWQRGFSN